MGGVGGWGRGLRRAGQAVLVEANIQRKYKGGREACQAKSEGCNAKLLS